MPKAKQDKKPAPLEGAEQTETRPRKKPAARGTAKARKSSAADRAVAVGDTITIEYIGTLSNGFVFDKATPENPFVFTIGSGQVLPKFEAMVNGMKIGETRTFTIHMLEAFGPYREQMVITVPRDSFPPGQPLEVGKRARVADNDGNQEVMRVVELTDTTVRLDGNHPLAGQSLSYHNVTVTAIG